MRKAFLVALALVFVSCVVISGCADSASEGQPVTFPDKNLDKCIRQALDKEADDKITTTELATLTEFSATAEGISNISGLEYCTNLTYLDLGLNQISDISPLANLTNLTNLCLLINHRISDISPLTNLTNLTSLWISGNKINDTSPLANLTNLTDLQITDNQISDISPLAGLTKLTHLEIRTNQISDISPLANLTDLNYLDLSNNQIDDISSLVENLGLGEGDTLCLEENNLDLEEGSDDMENFRILEDRGVSARRYPNVT
jgi:Leucine-rich repeat (LRR) protein